jgi:hypothetical protein
MLIMASPKQLTLTRKNITIMSAMIFISMKIMTITVMKIMTITVMPAVIIIINRTRMISITANYTLGFNTTF